MSDYDVIVIGGGAPGEHGVGAPPKVACVLRSSSASSIGLTGLRGDVVRSGEEPTGRGFIRGSNQYANTQYLQLRVLSSGIIRRHN